MGVTDSKELVKNDPRFDYNDTYSQKQANGKQHKDYEEEEKYVAKTQTSNDGEEEMKESQYGTPSKNKNYRKQVFADMTRRVLKNKESFSSSKMSTTASTGYSKFKHGKNVDTDGIEWVSKNEIIDNRMV